MNSSILMILTDSLINDMDDTIDALFEVSYLLISVIIIGIGNGGRKANRNLFLLCNMLMMEKN